MSEALKKIILKIDNKDVTSFFAGIYIFTTLDSPTWSCQIKMLDTSNLITNLPIIHGTKIDISVETAAGNSSDGLKEFTFYVYKISDKEIKNQKTETYTLHCAPYEFLLNNTKRVTAKYETMKVTDIIQDVAKKHLNLSLNVTASDNNNDVLINNWTPFISIGWLLKQAHINGRADFLFFQSANNQWTLETIENLYSNTKYKLKDRLVYRIQNIGNRKDPYQILKHSFEHVDVQQNMQNGYYKSTTVSFDFRKKNWAETIYSIGDDNSEDKKVDKQWTDKLFDNAEKAVITFMPKMAGLFKNPTGYDDLEKWVPSRRAALQHLDQEKLTVQLKGNAGAVDWLGKNLFVDLPNHGESEDPTFLYDSKRKGMYLVTAVNYWIEPGLFVNNIELVKRRLEQTS